MSSDDPCLEPIISTCTSGEGLLLGVSKVIDGHFMYLDVLLELRITGLFHLVLHGIYWGLRSPIDPITSWTRDIRSHIPLQNSHPPVKPNSLDPQSKKSPTAGPTFHGPRKNLSI